MMILIIVTTCASRKIKKSKRRGDLLGRLDEYIEFPWKEVSDYLNLNNFHKINRIHFESLEELLKNEKENDKNKFGYYELDKGLDLLDRLLNGEFWNKLNKIDEDISKELEENFNKDWKNLLSTLKNELTDKKNEWTSKLKEIESADVKKSALNVAWTSQNLIVKKLMSNKIMSDESIRNLLTALKNEAVIRKDYEEFLQSLNDPIPNDLKLGNFKDKANFLCKNWIYGIEKKEKDYIVKRKAIYKKVDMFYKSSLQSGTRTVSAGWKHRDPEYYNKNNWDKIDEGEKYQIKKFFENYFKDEFSCDPDQKVKSERDLMLEFQDQNQDLFATYSTLLRKMEEIQSAEYYMKYIKEKLPTIEDEQEKLDLEEKYDEYAILIEDKEDVEKQLKLADQAIDDAENKQKSKRKKL